MKKSIWMLGMVIILGLAGCGTEVSQGENSSVTMKLDESECLDTGSLWKENSEQDGVEQAKKEEPADFICEEGTNLSTRISTPVGYERIGVEAGSFAEFLRNYPVKEDGSPVLLYNGKEKSNQSAHVAVFALPLEAENLQQCADSVMRMYAEYFYETGQGERVAFHFVNGFAAEYTKWRDGYRIAVNGNQVSWVKSGEYDDSYETFVQYLRMVFAYAGTLSMEGEAEGISLEEARAGDIFLMGGSPGHVVMIVDVCENSQGKKAFLLAQGYMPAQEFHILKNPTSTNDPWYYEEEITYPLKTPEYSFSEGSLKRLQY